MYDNEYCTQYDVMLMFQALAIEKHDYLRIFLQKSLAVAKLNRIARKIQKARNRNKNCGTVL